MTGVIADIVVSDETSPLQTAVGEHGTAELEVQSCVAEEGAVAPFVWIHGSPESIDAVERSFEDEPTIASSRRMTECDDGDDRRLYRIEWVDERSVLGQLVEHSGTVLSATLDGGGWHIQFVFPTREGLSAAYEDWDTDRWEIYVDRIVSCDEESIETTGLTDEQHQAMERAVERGYYDIPRRITLKELAADLEISHQALSERLRRANRNLITNAVHDPKDRDQPVSEGADTVRILE
jgi:hypothetical protein